MVRHKAVIFIFALSVLLCGCGINARIRKADMKYEIGEFYAAGEMYKKIYPKLKRTDKRKAEIAFKQGECFRLLGNPRTPNVYQNAIRYHYPDSIVYLRQGQAYLRQGKYGEAAKVLQIYVAGHPDDSLGHYYLKAAKNAPAWRKIFSRYKVKAADDFNQKRTSNFSPQFIGNSSDAVMFTSNRRPKGSKEIRPSQITGVMTNNLYSTRTNAQGKWENPELAEGLNAEGMEQGVCSFTGDGKTVYFSRAFAADTTDIGAQIYVSERGGGEWTEPQQITLFSDSTISIAHPAISADGQTLVFVSDAPDGFGGKDLWMAQKVDDGWVVENMGEDINTAGDEMFPTLRSDGQLYYSSNGLPGFGGLDLFNATYDEELKKWVVLNMGYPFNTESDDFGITFAGDGEHGFFSSNRGQRKAYDLIYSFVLPELRYIVEGKVTDTNNEIIGDGTIRIVGTDGLNAKVQLKKDGTYKVRLNPDAKYIMLCTSRGYLNQKSEVTTVGEKDSKTYSQDFHLATISKPVTMDNIFYEFGKWELTPQSEAGLQSLVKLLNDNPNITIELSAHTDMVGNETANKTLSEKRAQSVVDYLIKNGIEKERLTPMGYGKERPVVVDAALNKKYKFLPVGQVLDPEFILTLKSAEQEIANQINRRTEFKVLSTTYKLY